MTGKLHPQFSGTDWNNFTHAPFWPKWQPSDAVPKVGDFWLGHFWNDTMRKDAVATATQLFSGGAGGTVRQYLPGLDGIQSSTANLRLRTMENIQIRGVASLSVLVNGTEAEVCNWQGARYQGASNAAAVRALIDADCLARRFTRIEITAVGAAGGGTVPPVQIDDVNGPFTSAHGDDYWLQEVGPVGATEWFIWWNIDSDPAPDVRRPLALFLQNSMADFAYRQDVYAQAGSLGYPGAAPLP